MPRCGRPARRAVSRPVCAHETDPALSVDRKLRGTSKRASHPARPVPDVAPHDPPRSAVACRSATPLADLSLQPFGNVEVWPEAAVSSQRRARFVPENPIRPYPCPIRHISGRAGVQRSSRLIVCGSRSSERMRGDSPSVSRGPWARPRFKRGEVSFRGLRRTVR
jgi:hypothetical protein